MKHAHSTSSKSSFLTVGTAVGLASTTVHCQRRIGGAALAGCPRRRPRFCLAISYAAAPRRCPRCRFRRQLCSFFWPSPLLTRRLWPLWLAEERRHLVFVLAAASSGCSCSVWASAACSSLQPADSSADPLHPFTNRRVFPLGVWLSSSRGLGVVCPASQPCRTS